MNYATAKGIEQALIEVGRRTGPGIANAINSVSANSKYYDVFKNYGNEMLKHCQSKWKTFEDLYMSLP